MFRAARWADVSSRHGEHNPDFSDQAWLRAVEWRRIGLQLRDGQPDE